MSEEILINVTPRETRVGVVENGMLQELHIERASRRGVVGNIYKGRVQRVLPGMQAAFVEVGLERTAFLHVADMLAGPAGAPGDAPPPQPPIGQLLRERTRFDQHGDSLESKRRPILGGPVRQGLDLAQGHATVSCSKIENAVGQVAILIAPHQGHAGLAVIGRAAHQIERRHLPRLQGDATADSDNRIEHRALAT